LGAFLILVGKMAKHFFKNLPIRKQNFSSVLPKNKKIRFLDLIFIENRTY